MPTKMHIEQTSRRKFNGRNDKGADQSAEQKGKAEKVSVGEKNKAETKSAAYSHRPMGVPAEGDFQRIIASRAYQIKEGEEEKRKVGSGIFLSVKISVSKRKKDKQKNVKFTADTCKIYVFVVE